MTNREMFERNQQLSTEFDLYVLDHPQVSDRIPDGALVVFIPAFDKELARRNRALAHKSRAPGQPVVFVQVERMAASRLQGLTLKVAWLQPCLTRSPTCPRIGNMPRNATAKNMTAALEEIERVARRVVREELTRAMRGLQEPIEPGSPLARDLVEIARRPARGRGRLRSRREVFGG